MRYVVYGAGAVGGVIGARLHLAGLPTTLVARGEHLARIRQHGLRLDTAEGVLAARAPATDRAAEVAWTPATVVLLAVKSQQTAAALEGLVAHASRSTPVVAVQNGVANEAAVLRRFPRAYGICVMLPSTHLDPGVVVQKCHPTPGILDVGRFPGGTDEVAEAVSADLRTAGFESVPRPDIMAWKYRKLLMNLGNGVDAACVPDGAADELAARVVTEGEAVLAAAGIPVVSGAQDRERRGTTLRRREDLAPAGGSTWQSVTRGTAVEVDYLSGEIVLLGRLHGVPTPANELVQQVTTDLARDGGEPRSIPAGDLLARLS
jgi:2-dehydropantoate 2-reductase